MMRVTKKLYALLIAGMMRYHWQGARVQAIAVMAETSERTKQ